MLKKNMLKIGNDSKIAKPSQLPVLSYISRGNHRINKPSKNANSVIPLVIKHIGGKSSAKKPEYLDASNVTDLTVCSILKMKVLK